MGKKSKKKNKLKSNAPLEQNPPTVKPSPDIGFQFPVDSFRWIALILIVIVGISAYFTSFNNKFIWDDTMVITPNEYIRDWTHLKEIFTTDIHHFGLDKSNFYRPLQGVSYAIDHTFWKLNPRGYHIGSAIYHVLNAFLIYLIFVAVFGFLDPKIRERSQEIALGMSLIWVVHPIHTQAVTYAAGRADQLVAMFILLCLFFFMKGKRIASWGCFVGALLSKEFGVITPALIILFDYFGLTENKEKRLKKMIPFLIIFGVYAVLRLTIIKFPQEETTAFIPGLYGRLMTSVQTIMILFGLLVAPFDLSMDRNIDWANTIFNWRVIVSGISVAAMGGGAWIWRKKQPMLSFALLWFFVGYFPFMNIIKMNANVSEHWMYLPSLGFWMMFCYVLVAKVPLMKRPIWMSLIVLLCVYFSFFLVKRNADFQNEITFYNQILKRSYDNARVHYNIGCAYFYEEDMVKSKFHLQEAIRINPDYAAAYGNLGQLEYREGNREEAIKLYEKANSIKVDLIENRSNLGTAYSEVGKYAQAIEQLQVALQLNPKHIGALNNLGIVYGRMGKLDKAEEYFRTVLQLTPGDPSAIKNIQQVQFLRQKAQKNVKPSQGR